VVVPQHRGFVKVGIVLIRLAQRGQMDTRDRAMRARHTAAQVSLCQALARDGGRALESPGLQIARGQRADLVQRDDVDGRAQLVIFFHHGQQAAAVDDERFEFLAAHHRAQAQARANVGIFTIKIMSHASPARQMNGAPQRADIRLLTAKNTKVFKSFALLASCGKKLWHAALGFDADVDGDGAQHQAAKAHGAPAGLAHQLGQFVGE
jgi:hypothetical protein